jgi:tetratricopeptide (TPR) repeat protein
LDRDHRAPWHRGSGLAGVLVAVGLATSAAVADTQIVAPRSLTGAYLGGVHANAVRDFDAAARYFGLALDADPENTALLARAFTFAVAGGEMAEAARLASDLVIRMPDDQLAHMMLALEAAKAGRWDAAETLLGGVETGGIAQIVTPVVSAWLHAGRGDIPGALEVLDRLSKTRGFESMAAVQRALVLDFSGDLRGARAAYEVLGEAGRTARITEALGAIYQRLGERDLARGVYAAFSDSTNNPMLEGAIDRFEQNLPPEAMIRSAADGIAESMFYIASVVAQEQRDNGREIALIYAQFAVYMRPDFPAGQILLGDILVQNEQPLAAIAIYEGVAEGTPASWLARLRVTNALEETGRIGEAITLTGDLVAERPDAAAPYLRLGDLYRAESMFDKAIAAYDDAARRDKTLISRDWTFLYRRGIALERAGAFDRAEVDLRAAMALNPEYAHLLNYLGYSLLDRGEKLDEAEVLIRRAVALAPSDGYIVDSLGWVYYRIGQMDEAVKTLERAVSLRPEDAAINDHLGDAYWRQGRRREARYQWAQALRTADDPKLTEAIRRKLDSDHPVLAEIDEDVSARGPTSAN